jgi:hypothetical protein
LNYTVPLERMPSLEAAFAGLEELRIEGVIEDYEVSRTTLEDIFCQFARVQREEGSDAAVPTTERGRRGSGGPGLGRGESKGVGRGGGAVFGEVVGVGAVGDGCGDGIDDDDAAPLLA